MGLEKNSAISRLYLYLLYIQLIPGGGHINIAYSLPRRTSHTRGTPAATY